MKPTTFIFRAVAILLLVIPLFSCSDHEYLPNPNELLKKIKQGDYIIEEISYNQNKLIDEVNSTLFYRKFRYNQNLQLIKEEVAISPLSYSSSVLPGSIHEFVDPEKTGISMYHLYEYNSDGRLSIQLNYIPGDGVDEFRSKNIYEYDADNRISKVLLYNSNAEVTQFRTYLYDSNGNVIEEDYYTYLFVTNAPVPKHMSKITFEYDSFHNPYRIFEKSGNPGINSNRNNIIKRKTINYDPEPGLPAISESITLYEYNYTTGYPTRVINGEEFIY